jgi:hypothetical protein
MRHQRVAFGRSHRVLAHPFGTPKARRVLVSRQGATAFASEVKGASTLSAGQIYAQDAPGVVSVRASTSLAARPADRLTFG